MKKSIVMFVFLLFILCACDRKDIINTPTEGFSKVQLYSGVDVCVEIDNQSQIKKYVDKLNSLDVTKTKDFFRESPNTSLRFYSGNQEEFIELEFNSFSLLNNAEHNLDESVLICVSKKNISNAIPQVAEVNFYYTDDLEVLFTVNNGGCVDLTSLGDV